MRKLFAALFGALCLASLAVAAAPASATYKPAAAPALQLSAAPPIRAMAGPFNACRSVYYTNGYKRFTSCTDYYTQTPDSTRWRTYQRRVFNPPAGAYNGLPGGDTIGYACDWENSGQGFDCLDGISDGQTEILTQDWTMGNGSTYWVEISGGPGAGYCNKVYTNSGGGTDHGGC